jgi:two-component system, response regulator
MENLVTEEKYILLVEDNPNDVELTQIAFKRCQVPSKLEVVYDGQEALDFLFGQGKYAGRDTSNTPAVIILDLKLPFVSGLEVLRQVRMNTETCRIPVVVLSSSTNQNEINACFDIGINRYCRKPDKFEQFANIIDEIRNTWLDGSGSRECS